MKIKTEEQLDKLKKKAIKDFIDNGYGNEIEFTCDDCNVRDKCQFAYDIYNTDGDCLAMK